MIDPEPPQGDLKRYPRIILGSNVGLINLTSPPPGAHVSYAPPMKHQFTDQASAPTPRTVSYTHLTLPTKA